MNYTVKFNYAEGPPLCITIDRGRVEWLLNNLVKGEVYWSNDAKDNGFWLPFDKIRSVQFMGVSDGPADDDKGSKEVSQEDGIPGEEAS